jgi:ferredoxin
VNAVSRATRWISLGAACLLALPLPLGMLAGLHLHLSPFLLLQSLLSRAPFVPLSLLAAGVLILAFRRERWFCRNLCPTGALCDAVAACRRRRPAWDKVPFVNRALAVAALGAAVCGAPILSVLDPVSIFHGAWGFLALGMSFAAGAGALGLAALLLSNLLFPRLWCARLCPLGGLQLLAQDLRRAPPDPSAKPDLGRRHLIAAASGIALGLATRQAVGNEASVLRPPGALPEARFRTACCRCGTCARACPTRIIRPATDLRDPSGLLAPCLDFSRSYCLPACAACGRVCPTGAIAPFGPRDKGRRFIGTAAVRLDGCRLLNGKDCNRCVPSCAFDALRIAGGLFDSAPEVDASRCVGCGACVAACPEEVIDVRPRRGPL